MKCTVKGNIRSHNIQLFNGCGCNSIQLLTGSEDNICCWRNQLITDLLYFIIFNAFYFNFFSCFLVLLAYRDQLILYFWICILYFCHSNSIQIKSQICQEFFLSMCDVKIFLTFTSPNMVLLWQLFYLFCSCI